MKKIVSLLLIFVVVIGSVVPSFAETNNISLNIEQAIKLAEENSITIKNYESKLLIAERELKSAEHNADNVDLDGILSDATYLANGKMKDLTPIQKERALSDLKTDRDEAIKDLKINVTTAYISLYNAELSLKSKKETIEIQKKELVSIQKKLDLGLATKNEVLDLENNLKQAELDLQKLEWTIQMSEMELSKLLGINLNSNIILTEVPNLNVTFEYDVEVLSKQAQLQGASVIKAEKDLEMKELEKTVDLRYTRYRSKTDETIENFDKAIEDLKKAVEDAKVSEEVKIRSDYNGILNAQLDLEIAKLKLEISQRTLNTQQVKYDLGMIVYLDVTKAQNDVESSMLTIQEKELSLFKLVENFDHYIKDFVSEAE